MELQTCFLEQLLVFQPVNHSRCATSFQHNNEMLNTLIHSLVYSNRSLFVTFLKSIS